MDSTFSARKILKRIFSFQEYKNTPHMNWIEDIIQNENKALTRIYNEYRGECISWLRKNYSLSDSDGIEVYQNAMIILYDNVMERKVTEATSSVKSYLFSIAKNKAYELLRKKKKTESLDTFDFASSLIQEDYNTDEKQEQEYQFELLETAMNELGDPCKTLLHLYYYAKMSMDSICAKMGYDNRNSVKTQKYKCMKRLQKIVL